MRNGNPVQENGNCIHKRILSHFQHYHSSSSRFCSDDVRLHCTSQERPLRTVRIGGSGVQVNSVRDCDSIFRNVLLDQRRTEIRKRQVVFLRNHSLGQLVLCNLLDQKVCAEHYYPLKKYESVGKV